MSPIVQDLVSPVTRSAPIGNGGVFSTLAGGTGGGATPARYGGLKLKAAPWQLPPNGATGRASCQMPRLSTIAVAGLPMAVAVGSPPGGIAPLTAYAKRGSRPSYPPWAFSTNAGWMETAATIPPPGDGEPGPLWKRWTCGHVRPCGLTPVGGISSGLRGSDPVETIPVGTIGRYLPPAPATSLPCVTAPEPWLDGPGWVSPPPPPAARTVTPGRRARMATAANERAAPRISGRTVPLRPVGRPRCPGARRHHTRSRRAAMHRSTLLSRAPSPPHPKLSLRGTDCRRPVPAHHRPFSRAASMAVCRGDRWKPIARRSPRRKFRRARLAQWLDPANSTPRASGAISAWRSGGD